MMRAHVSVTVKYLNLVKDVMKKQVDKMTLKEGSTIGDLLGNIKETHGVEISRYLFSSSGKLKPHIRFVRSGSSCQEESESFLSDGDELYMFVATSGG